MRTNKSWRGLHFLVVLVGVALALTGCAGQVGANPSYYKLAGVNAVQCTVDNAASTEAALRATAGSVAEAMKDPSSKLARDIADANNGNKDFTLNALSKALVSKADECSKLKPIATASASPSASPTVSGAASASPTPTPIPTINDTLTQEQIVALTQSATTADFCGRFVKSFTFQGQVHQVLPVNDPNKVEKKYGTSVLHPMKSSDDTGVADEVTEAVCLYPYYGGQIASGLSLLKFANADITQLNPVVGPWTLDHSDAERAQRAASFNPDLSGVKFDVNGQVADAASAELVKAWLAKRAEWQKEANRILDLFFKFQANGISERQSVKNFWQLPAEIPTVGLAPHEENLQAQEFVLTDKDAVCPVIRFGINRDDMRFELFEACPAPTQPAPTSPGTSTKPSSPPTHSGCPTGTVWSPEVKKCITSKSSNPKDYKTEVGAPKATVSEKASAPSKVETTTSTGGSATQAPGTEVTTKPTASAPTTPAPAPGANTNTSAPCAPAPGETSC